MWLKTISEYDGATPSPPADPSHLARAEQVLDQPLPTALRDLLLECNGVSDEYGTEVVWGITRILEANLSFRSEPSFRSLYMPFEPLVFFGENGGGDQFAFVRTPSRDDVFVWDHETDSRTWIAPRLEPFLRNALTHPGTDWYRPL
ncbi:MULTISPECIES: SMI1/KNR4 family protein [Streptomyces]|uniref:SMI1/KNR4 family protein n=1 Tax=Streptomyces TaxID=1883 RepID=UPI001676778B|nr:MULTISPECIES: SMI1/KNR4 family protein [Streptomyces]MBD3577558.1 SMI1/KNR4 family protein [Streptomyces sp. KD18]GGT09957.1 SMI1/KNR4 family protein [Streptomyces toxytricini]